MTRFGLVLFLLILALIAGGVAWYLVSTSKQAAPSGTPVASTTPLSTGDAIYTNGIYGFMLQYPEAAVVENTFGSFYHLGTYWRANALPNATGTPVVSIVSYSTVSDHSYPRYYSSLIRVGVSMDKKEVAQCLKVTPNQGETLLPDVVLNGTTWKAFSFQNAGMQQYVKGVSYRAIHEGYCVALEKIAVGSSYRDDPDSPDDILDTVLEQHYQDLDRIVQSFAFAKP